jgi:hypothetical protein
VPIQRRISDFKPLFTNLAQTSHYEVSFGGLHPRLTSYLSRKGISSRFIAEDAGLLCHSAVLPTTQLATANITGNFMGITEKFAHTRQYNEISLDFYVDRNYNAIKFMETWMEFIASGSNNPIDSPLQPISQNRKDYISRMQYPEYYKSDRTKIVKFDRDYGQEIEYSFIGLFPFQIASIPVTYASSEVLKMTAVFQYDRYIAGKSLSLNEFNQDSNNNQSTQSPNPFVSNVFDGNPLESPISVEDAFRIGNNLNTTSFGSFGVSSDVLNNINFSE